MLEVFQALAVRLAWMRSVAVLITVGFVALFFYAAFADNAPDSFFTSGLAGAVWGLLLFVFLTIFPNVPKLPTSEHTRWQSFKIRFRRVGYGLLVLGFLMLTAVSMSLTLKLLKSL